MEIISCIHVRRVYKVVHLGDQPADAPDHPGDNLCTRLPPVTHICLGIIVSLLENLIENTI